MSLGTVEKDPDATVQYEIDWADYLGQDTISASSWVVPTGLNQVGVNISGTKTSVKVSGGSLGMQYVLTNRITTNGGIVDDRSILVKVRAQ